MDKKQGGIRCSMCRREIDEGMDALEVNEGVLGTHGFVPIAEPLLFCCSACLRDYFRQGRFPEAPKRIP